MSLVSRFSAFFLLALALALAGFSICLYALETAWLHQGFDRELKQALDRARPGFGPGDPRVGWALLGVDDHGVGGWAQGWSQPPFGVEAALCQPETQFTLAGNDGAIYRVMTRAPDRGRPPRPPGRDDEPERKNAPRGRPPVLAVWRSIGPLEADLRALMVVLAVTSVSLWVAAAALGRYFGSRALSPIKDMADRARLMPWEDENERLPSPRTGDELEEFALNFNGLLDRLHEALERQKQFTGQASHQLRTPLAGLIAAVDVARRKPRTVAEHERILDQLHADAVRLWRIVEALLFLARADAEAALPDLEEIELGDWLASRVDDWREHDHSRDIVARARDTPLMILSHPALLGQLFDNLIENACKYSAPGRAIKVSAGRDGDCARIEVIDSGPGIAAHDLERVFDPFFRAEAARRQGLSGVGLGLPVALRIARTLGGDLTVSSTPGRGSVFTVTLKTASPRTAAATPMQAAGAP